jgi:hypothetical protein
MRAAVAMRAVLAKKPLLGSDMIGCLLAGAGPVLGDRYERGARKVSWKDRKLKVESWKSKEGSRIDAGAAQERRVHGKGKRKVYPSYVLVTM